MRKIMAGTNCGQTYPILIGSGLLASFTQNFDISPYTKVAILSDKNVSLHWGEKLKLALPKTTHLIEIHSSEGSKSLEVAETLWRNFAELGLDRKSLLINLGGGMVSDLGGFTASVYMRGIDCVNLPTTLLAQVDASLGGKTGVNFLGAKNLLGTFNNPKAVIIALETLETLPQRELSSGMAELIKAALISDPALFDALCATEFRSLTAENLEPLIARACEIKLDVVTKDPHESGLRQILNFGHTVGHALEAISLKGSNPLLHGEAVALGIVAEAKISCLLGRISAVDLARIKSLLLRFNLPIFLTNSIERSQVLEMIRRDKKNLAGKTRFVLLNSIGSADFGIEVGDELILASLDELYGAK